MSLFSSFFGNQTKAVIGPVTPLDLVTYAAALASDPSQIDEVLDQVRAITARLGPGQQPSAEDTVVFLRVYVQIEQYLTTKEPIRAFTKTELRAKMSPMLRAQLEQYEAKKGA